MIEQTIHRKNFDLALHYYLNAHEYQTAVDTDLFEKFTEIAMNDYPNVYDWNGNPLNVTNYVRPFFYLQTFPLIKVVSSPDGLSYTYQQAPYIQNGLPNNTVFLWNIPLWTEPAQDYLPWLISQKSLDNDFPSGWNIVNPRRKVYARVWYVGCVIKSDEIASCLAACLPTRLRLSFKLRLSSFMVCACLRPSA
jgi:hypothetical protein